MKHLLDPQQVEAFRDRGTSRTPVGLGRFLDGRHGAGRTRGVFPHGRFWLWLEMWCPTLADRPHPDNYDFAEIQVYALYWGVLPWLGYGFGDPRGSGRAVDLVDLVDELMDNEYRWYASAVPWPIADVLAVFADVFSTLYLESQRDLRVAWDAPTQTWLRRSFVEMVRALEAHEDCCEEIRVNVHWW